MGPHEHRTQEDIRQPQMEEGRMEVGAGQEQLERGMQ